MLAVLLVSLLIVTGMYIDLQRMRKAVRVRSRAHRCNCPHCEVNR